MWDDLRLSVMPATGIEARPRPACSPVTMDGGMGGKGGRKEGKGRKEGGLGMKEGGLGMKEGRGMKNLLLNVEGMFVKGKVCKPRRRNDR